MQGVLEAIPVHGLADQRHPAPAVNHRPTQRMPRRIVVLVPLNHLRPEVPRIGVEIRPDMRVLIDWALSLRIQREFLRDPVILIDAVMYQDDQERIVEWLPIWCPRLAQAFLEPAIVHPWDFIGFLDDHDRERLALVLTVEAVDFRGLDRTEEHPRSRVDLPDHPPIREVVTLVFRVPRRVQVVGPMHTDFIPDVAQLNQPLLLIARVENLDAGILQGQLPDEKPDPPRLRAPWAAFDIHTAMGTILVQGENPHLRAGKERQGGLDGYIRHHPARPCAEPGSFSGLFPLMSDSPNPAPGQTQTQSTPESAASPPRLSPATATVLGKSTSRRHAHSACLPAPTPGDAWSHLTPQPPTQSQTSPPW